jgi:hypothetical protein
VELLLQIMLKVLGIAHQQTAGAHPEPKIQLSNASH